MFPHPTHITLRQFALCVLWLALWTLLLLSLR